MELSKVFAPREIEDALYREWESKGYFKPVIDKSKTPFTIVMPPPNITGQLHMGHALDAMPQDALARYHRMKGDPTLWVPGTDHASIATEIKIVEAMKKEGLTKQDVGREGFLTRAWAWREKFGRRIVEQQKKLGSSCDWSRERFTMDEGCNHAVVEVFVRLYEKGLIYRGNRIINWCPVCKTALSDTEVEYVEQTSNLWYIRYPGPDGQDVVVATTRPETMLGDTGVAVNPNDPRYQSLVGKTVTLPIVNRPIPVVADEYCEMEFGTGAVKMTPAHDPNDFEVAQRHNLEIIRVIADDGTMNENAGAYAGMTREACREAIVEKLKDLGLLVKIEPLTHNVGTCYRCHQNVEPLTSTQWFVKMKPLAEPAMEAVKKGEVQFVPERFAKTYFNWMENIRDWCVSRQLWWGHRIPAYYCDKCGEMIVSREQPTCPKCGGAMRQDEDVLDTWFSSALWPFSTLGWPEKTEDLAYFYPTSVLACGYDIIFFWVSRMIFSGIEQMGKPPFHTVLLHGLVRDAQGRKMSKSLGNGIDPLEIIDKYGTDALRISLALGVSPGNDLRVSDEKFEAARNFANKIWNAARFVMMNLEDYAPAGLPAPEALSLPDRWILTRFNEVRDTVSAHMEDYDLGLAAQALYEFIWSAFCDWYIELAKQALNGEDKAARACAQGVLHYVLEGTMKLLHPFMPFITDAIYGALPGCEGSIMVSAWPEDKPEYRFPDDARHMEGVMDAIRAIRNLRAEMNVQAGRRAHVSIRPADGWRDTFADAGAYFTRLAYASGVALLDEGAATPDKSASCVCAAGEMYMPLGELVDLDKEKKRLEKDIENAEREIARGEAKLNNPGFLGKAPAALIDTEKEKLATNRAMLASLKARQADLA